MSFGIPNIEKDSQSLLQLMMRQKKKKIIGQPSLLQPLNNFQVKKKNTQQFNIYLLFIQAAGIIEMSAHTRFSDLGHCFIITYIYLFK